MVLWAGFVGSADKSRSCIFSQASVLPDQDKNYNVLHYCLLVQDEENPDILKGCVVTGKMCHFNI